MGNGRPGAVEIVSSTTRVSEAKVTVLMGDDKGSGDALQYAQIFTVEPGSSYSKVIQYILLLYRMYLIILW
jgi:hypothetical protein